MEQNGNQINGVNNGYPNQPMPNQGQQAGYPNQPTGNAQYMGGQPTYTADPTGVNYNPQNAVSPGMMANPNNGVYYQGAPQNRPVNNYSSSFSNPVAPGSSVPQPPKKIPKAVIAILAAVGVLVCAFLTILLMNIGPFSQGKGYDSVQDLADAYATAISKGDIDAYLELLPKCERTSAEKKFVQQCMTQLEATGPHSYTFKVGPSKSITGGKLNVIKDKFASLSSTYVRVSAAQEVNITVVDAENDNAEQNIKIVVIDCGGKFFVDDIIEK